MSRAEVIDRAWRGAYWLGYRLARLWWRVRRPDHHGVMVAVWLDGMILGVGQSYSDRVTWPGGGINPGEDATHAARRELREELGLSVRAEDLTLVGRVTAEYDFRQDHVRIFELHLTTPPVLTPDNREIVRACFMRPRDMLAATTPPFVRGYLLERAAP